MLYTACTGVGIWFIGIGSGSFVFLGNTVLLAKTLRGEFYTEYALQTIINSPNHRGYYLHAN
jgi:hypothetical protein